MRVVAGTYGGRKLVAPAGSETRPTSDRVREALFSVLGATVDDARVLDLFAGSGALGIEALSRGARSAVFVDSSRKAIRAVKANLAALGIEADVRPVAARCRAPHGIRPSRGIRSRLPRSPVSACRRAGAGTLGRAGRGARTGARVVTESDRRAPLQLDLPLADERRYGDTVIRIHDT